MNVIKLFFILLLGVLQSFAVRAATTTGAAPIKAVNSGLCLDVYGASTSNGAAIIQWVCQGSSNQNFTLKANTAGQYQIVSASSGKCITAASKSQGALLTQSTCGSSSLQLFTASQSGAGIYNLLSVASGLCIDVTAQSTTQGTQLQVWSCNGGTNQQFGLTLPGAAPKPTPTPTPPKPTPSPTPVSGLPGEQAKMADAFVDSIGVLTHIENTGNYTSLYSTWVNRIQTAGIRHIRDGFWTQAGSTAAKNLMTTIKNATGVQVKFLLTQGTANCTDVTVDSPTLYSGWGWTASQIDAFEAMNELGGSQGWCASNSSPPWYSFLGSDVQYLRSTMNGINGFASLPLVAPSFDEYGQSFATIQADAKSVGNITSNIAYGNVHIYCSQNSPSCEFSNYPAALTPEIGSLPYLVTETGYTTVPGGGDGTVQQTGKYYSHLFFDWFNHGANRVYAYELLDDTSTTGGEANFGILYSDASPKPAYTAISNTINLLQDPGAAFAPGSLSYTVAGAPATLKHTLLQKRDGTFYLALWMDQNYYDTFSPATITVTFSGAKQKVTQYVPLTSVNAAATWTNVTSVTLTVADQATVLAISP